MSSSESCIVTEHHTHSRELFFTFSQWAMINNRYPLTQAQYNAKVENLQDVSLLEEDSRHLETDP